MAINLKAILGKLFVNDKQIVTLEDTAENGSIESGSNVNGNWTKFPDGTLICTVSKSYTGIDITLGAGALPFRSVSIESWTFPAPFIENPKITTGSIDINSRMISCHGVTHTSISTYGINVTSVTNVTVSGELVAIGRWK